MVFRLCFYYTVNEYKKYTISEHKKGTTMSKEDHAQELQNQDQDSAETENQRGTTSSPSNEEAEGERGSNT